MTNTSILIINEEVNAYYLFIEGLFGQYMGPSYFILDNIIENSD